MKKISVAVGGFIIAVFGVIALAPTAPTYAQALDAICNQTGQNDQNEACRNRGDDASSLIGTIVEVLLFVIAAVSVVMIIYGGILYTTSAGDAGRVKKAKDTLMYSIIGLVVAFLAYAIVNWVLRIL